MGKRERIAKITQLYYSNPKIVEAMLAFSLNREVVPRYLEGGFGKRPDTLQYGSDVAGLVRKGATSFHASEEVWSNPLNLDSNFNRREFDELRSGWDLLIDIDSPFFDCSKIAAQLIIAALEQHGIKNYGIKFSGSKGFHLILPWKAFPKEYSGEETKNMFPEWPRAICEYLMNYIRRDYNKKVGEILSVEDIEKRTKLSREDLIQVTCLSCNRAAKKGNIIKLKCSVCNLEAEKRNAKLTKRKLRCLGAGCTGVLEVVEEKEFYQCDYCKQPGSQTLFLNSEKFPEMFEKTQGVAAEKIASLDLVLVAPRHLFRMPYSLHEKTTLSSIVIDKDELQGFSPKDANPLKVRVKDFAPEVEPEEARMLLSAALSWKKGRDGEEEKFSKERYKNVEWKEQEIDHNKIENNMFPPPIKKLLQGLEDGKKRGLFILLTFFKSLGYPPEEINNRVREWNEKNETPLKEGYVRSQVDWHLKQRKKILPPNYANESFYKDLGLIQEMPKEKNPLVEVMRKLRRKGG
tara:strand:+ start:431 stop:1984 length:1554 start_codon:yes stop_codon:yes gene_type:complete